MRAFFGYLPALFAVITPLLWAWSPASDPADKGSWHLQKEFSDEFNGPLDRRKFFDFLPLQFFDDGVIQKDLEHHADTLFVPGNAYTADGKLCLTVKLDRPSREGGLPRKYSLPAISTRRLMRHGYFEVRARAAAAAMDSGFWLNKQHFLVQQPLASPWQLGPYQYGNEIDIFEINGNSGFRGIDWSRRHNMNAHVYGDLAAQPTGAHTDATSKVAHTEYDLPESAPSFTDAYHVFGLEWDEQQIQWYVNGKLKRQTTIAGYAGMLEKYNAPGQEPEGSHQRFYGTRFGNHTFRFPLQVILSVDFLPDWHGPAKDVSFPARMSVDYLRVWQKRGQGRELIANGGFDSAESWRPLEVAREAVAEVAYRGGEARISLEKSGAQPSSVILTQAGLALEPGARYSLSYTVQASRPHWFSARIVGADGSYYATFPECAPQDGSLGNGHVAYYSHTFPTPAKALPGQAMLQFFLGGKEESGRAQDDRRLVLDNVSVRRLLVKP